MTRILALSPHADVAQMLPALALLPHEVEPLAPRAAAAAAAPRADLVLVDATGDLAEARTLCRSLAELLPHTPRAVVMREGGLATLSEAWCVDELLLDTAGPAEVEARLRLIDSRAATGSVEEDPDEIAVSGVVIDPSGYTARINGRPMNLTYKEFELLRHLASHPGRVFSRDQLLHEVWGYDYFGGTRTVDVHVRRLRAKLGPDQEQLIGTVRNVGYRFVPRDGTEATSHA